MSFVLAHSRLGARTGVGKTLLAQLVLEKVIMLADQTPKARKDATGSTPAPAAAPAPMTPLLISGSTEYRPAALAHAYLRRGFGDDTLGYAGVGSGGAGGHSQCTAVRQRLRAKGALQARRVSTTHALDGRLIARLDGVGHAAPASGDAGGDAAAAAVAPIAAAAEKAAAAAAGGPPPTTGGPAAAAAGDMANITLRAHFAHINLSTKPIYVHECDTRTVLLCTSFNALAAAAAAPGARDNALYSLIRSNCAAHKGARLRPVPGAELRVFIDDVGGDPAGGAGGGATSGLTYELLRALLDHGIILDRGDRTWKEARSAARTAATPSNQNQTKSH
jgi:hypothetical protein